MDWWAVRNMSEWMGGWAGYWQPWGSWEKQEEDREKEERMRNPCFYPAFLPSCLAKQSAGAALHIHHCYSQWGECPSQGCSACVWARLATRVGVCVSTHVCSQRGCISPYRYHHFFIVQPAALEHDWEEKVHYDKTMKNILSLLLLLLYFDRFSLHFYHLWLQVK